MFPKTEFGSMSEDFMKWIFQKYILYWFDESSGFYIVFD